jgi:hypothetical protein
MDKLYLDATSSGNVTPYRIASQSERQLHIRRMQGGVLDDLRRDMDGIYDGVRIS